MRFAVVLWGEPNDKCRSLLDCPVLSYAEVLARGHRTSATFQSAALSSGQLATIVYTSGTTGNPKVLLLQTFATVLLLFFFCILDRTSSRCSET